MAQKKSIIRSEWRLRLLRERLATALILLELVLSAIFLAIGHFAGSAYVRGVGVGLVIAWATSAIAYYIKKQAKQ
jgi:hypothetical protein